MLAGCAPERITLAPQAGPPDDTDGRYRGTVRLVRAADRSCPRSGPRVLQVVGGQLVPVQVPMLNALNEVLRDDFIADSVAGVGRWNRVLEKAGHAQRLSVPHKAFNRHIGALAGVKVSPQGQVLGVAEWQAQAHQWLPTVADRDYVASLMGRVVEPGKFANWIAPPAIGINRQPVDFEYVRFN